MKTDNLSIQILKYWQTVEEASNYVATKKNSRIKFKGKYNLSNRKKKEEKTLLSEKMISSKNSAHFNQAESKYANDEEICSSCFVEN